MRKIVLALALALGACNGAPVGVPSAPAEVANQTKVDEQAALGAEVLYTTASTFGNTLSRTGVVDRVKFQALDARAYNALLIVRNAYRAGNSADFVSGLAQLNALVAEIRDLKEK